MLGRRELLIVTLAHMRIWRLVSTARILITPKTQNVNNMPGRGKKHKKLTPNQMKIARVAPPRDVITQADFKALRKNKKG